MNRLVNVVVVVLLALLGLLVLIPLLPRLRQTADRAHCQNNLRQIGQALQMYCDRHQAYPRAVFPTEGLPPEKCLSWVAAILPYANRPNLAEKLDPKAAWEAPANQEAVATPLRPFLCPVNPHRDEPGQPALTHYPGLTGFGADAARLPGGDPKAGFFGYARRLTPKDLTDGLENTLVGGESLNEVGPWAAGGFPTARGLDPQRQPYIGPDSVFGSLHFTDPNQPSTRLQSGANMLYADGSARFFAEATTPSVLEVLATVAGGEREEGF
jgi:prepilin-type processing-associated H-X9-DG protein